MPGLTRNQKEQAIECLNAGQRPWVISNNLNSRIQTIEWLRKQHNATNSMDDRPRSG
uniref:HTH psq-type domain-containing protein n=1 Tax=Octopus bimaculoides TaxID=37653 RepID=A0A0L8HMT8_OCTBM